MANVLFDESPNSEKNDPLSTMKAGIVRTMGEFNCPDHSPGTITVRISSLWGLYTPAFVSACCPAFEQIARKALPPYFRNAPQVPPRTTES